MVTFHRIQEAGATYMGEGAQEARYYLTKNVMGPRVILTYFPSTDVTQVKYCEGDGRAPGFVLMYDARIKGRHLGEETARDAVNKGISINSVNARPGINGNSPQQFMDLAQSLADALLEVENVMGQISSELFHGRNYQHTEMSDVCRKADLERVKLAKKQLAEMEAMAVELYNVAEVTK